MGITDEPVNNRFLQAEQANVACYLQAEQARPRPGGLSPCPIAQSGG